MTLQWIKLDEQMPDDEERVDNEDPADPSAHEPRVTGAPETIWLVYGELEHDDTHANCADSGEVTWCEDAQFLADVRYTRTDLVAGRVRGAVAAERERWESALGAVMPADFKDWHQNSAMERPAVAAWVIRNLRDREAHLEGVLAGVQDGA